MTGKEPATHQNDIRHTAQLIARMEGVASGVTAAFGAAGIGVACLPPARRVLIFSAEAQTLLGVSRKLPIKKALRAVDPRHRGRLLRLFGSGRAENGEGEGAIVVPLSTGDCTRKWIRLNLSPCGQGDGDVIVLQDVTAMSEEREALRRERDHFRHTVELNPQLPWVADPQGNVIAFTERYEKLTGRTQEELVGNGWEIITHPDDLPDAIERTTHSLMTGVPLDMRIRLRTAAGTYRWFRSTCYPLRDEGGQIVRWYGYTEDINDHVLIEQKIRWTAEHDALTKLPNRMVFNRDLERIIRGETTMGQKVAILLVDVDNFKDINDVLGHDAGDAMLVAFADLMRRVMPEKAMLARIGGDEFAILLPFEGPLTQVQSVSEAIFTALYEPMMVNGQNVECRASIGASVFPFHGQSPTELFKNADIALYQAKARGRGQMTLFSLEMKQETQRRVAMINLGRKAVETDSIIPYYQMQVSLDGNRPIGFEALLRRRDRQGRICAPASIAAAFEDAGVAEALGDAMLKAVLADMMRARALGVDLGTVSVNFSTAEFRSPSFADRLATRVADAGIDFGSFMIEVTESVFLGRQVDSVAETIRTLDKAGFKIALDDFGTGYASLVHLRQLPVDTLKIDQSFIRNLAESRDDLAIVTAIINLGASLDLNIIAEGIETETQLNLLRELNLQYGQGFLFAHPMPIEDACALIGAHEYRAVKGSGQWLPSGAARRVIGSD